MAQGYARKAAATRKMAWVSSRPMTEDLNPSALQKLPLVDNS
jgi:hypothetical protein